MVTGWRRAFCTTIPKDRETTSTIATTDKQLQQHCNTSSSNQNSPRISSKLRFFSNPSTPRFFSQQSQPPTSSLRCKTTCTTAATTPTSSVPNSPKLQTKTPTAKKSISPRLFGFSTHIGDNNNLQQQLPTPPSPKSPSTLSLIKSTLRLSKANSNSSSNRCGICLQSVKSGHGTAIFTAECTHVFHFPCVASHVTRTRQSILVCPVCNTPWSELPLLSLHDYNFQQQQQPPDVIKREDTSNSKGLKKSKALRVYNDDEPLMSPSPGCLFVPIPELEENDIADMETEFQGFKVNAAHNPMNTVNVSARRVELSLLPESAVVAVGRGYETHVAVMRVRAPPCTAARHPPVDLVAVIDVSERVSGVKSRMLRMTMVRKVMKLVVSSMNSNDRLSIVALNSTSKRLFPLRRMTADGRRLARRITDSIGSGSSHGSGYNNSNGDGNGSLSVSDALKKAVKVIEDRRDKNPVTGIIVLSDGTGDDRPGAIFRHHSGRNQFVFSTRSSHMDIPTHYINLEENNIACLHAQSEDSLSKCIGGLLTVAVQELSLQAHLVSGSAPAEITAVYSINGRPKVFKPNSVQVGDLHSNEERDFLVEFKVPTSCVGSQRILAIRSSSKDPTSLQAIASKETRLLLPRAVTVKSSNSIIQQLRSCHIGTKAVAESHRLVERRDLSGAYHLLSSARALLTQLSSSSETSSEYYMRFVEVELAELHRRRETMSRERLLANEDRSAAPLTPTSAWRAAERLAKVAIMRKHMNRVSDLHGFENARF